MDIERIVHQLVYHNNWDVIDEIDNGIVQYVFFHLPPKCRVVVEGRLRGEKNKEIATYLHMSVGSVGVHCSQFKSRLVNAMFGIYDNSHQHRIWKSNSTRHKQETLGDKNLREELPIASNPLASQISLP